MDGYSGKRDIGGLMAPRKSYNVALKDVDPERNRSAKFCSQIGCSVKLQYSQNTEVGGSGKTKWSNPSFHSSDGNARFRYSSSSIPLMTSAKKSYLDSRRMCSQSELHISGSSLLSEPEAPLAPPRSSPTGYLSKSVKKSKKFVVTEVGSSSKSPNIGPEKKFHYKSGSYNQDTMQASYISSTPKYSILGPSNSSKGSRYGLRNLRCNSISDVRPNCSFLESKTAGKNVVRKRSPEGERRLSHRGRKTRAASPLGRNVCSSCCISISNTRYSNSAFRTQRSMNVNNRMKLPDFQNARDGLCFREPASGIPDILDDEIPFNVGGQSPLELFSANITSSSSSSHSLSSSNDNGPSTIFPFTSVECGFTNLRNRDALHRYNLDGIAEVLLAVERFEQNEERTHEQVLALETSLFLSGLNLYDHHRDMRLDIDNMSYEELLALEERIGSVSTGLSQEALSKCLRRGTYQPTPSEVRVTDGDDIKCSICQEEYVTGDVMRKLAECQHDYHETCITKWLRMKNWCPICKVSAAPQHSSTT